MPSALILFSALSLPNIISPSVLFFCWFDPYCVAVHIVKYHLISVASAGDVWELACLVGVEGVCGVVHADDDVVDFWERYCRFCWFDPYCVVVHMVKYHLISVASTGDVWKLACLVDGGCKQPIGIVC